jgi:hypothetical protein
MIESIDKDQDACIMKNLINQCMAFRKSLDMNTGYIILGKKKIKSL